MPITNIKTALIVGASAYGCDASGTADVNRLFNEMQAALGLPDVAIYNASGRVRGAILGHRASTSPLS